MSEELLPEDDSRPENDLFEDDAPPEPGRNQDLIDRLTDSVAKLDNSNTTRGDLKILSRTLVELGYAFKVFAPYRKHRKVTVFGSARTPPGDGAYQQAVDFGKAMAERNWLVITGAAQGIMEAGHVGAGREMSMGLNIMLPFEQSSNEVIEGDKKLVHMKYFFTRKLMFVKECDAIVCLPGGFGTLDEAMEVLTLLQTGKRNMAPVVLLDEPGGTYWASLDQFIRQHLLAGGMISEEDLNLYLLTTDCQAAVDECLNFFRVYHSMRYVRKHLVLRLQQPLTGAQLESINTRFADILVDGEFEQSGALAAEHDEPDLAGMSRLVFHFNRRNLGRLRALINYVNLPAENT